MTNIDQKLRRERRLADKRRYDKRKERRAGRQAAPRRVERYQEAE